MANPTYIAGAQCRTNVADVRATAAACRVYAQARRLGVNFRIDDTESSIVALAPRVIAEPIGRSINEQVRANSPQLAPVSVIAIEPTSLDNARP